MICQTHGFLQTAANECPACRARRDPDGAIAEAADFLSKETFSHRDGRDLLAELHPRRTLDIKRRKDGVETWYEGDWLTRVWRARQILDHVIAEVAGRESRSPAHFPPVLALGPTVPQSEQMTGAVHDTEHGPLKDQGNGRGSAEG